MLKTNFNRERLDLLTHLANLFIGRDNIKVDNGFETVCVFIYVNLMAATEMRGNAQMLFKKKHIYDVFIDVTVHLLIRC